MVNFPLITFNALTKLKKAGFTHIRDQLASELTQIKSATPPDNKSLLNFGLKLEIYSFLFSFGYDAKILSVFKSKKVVLEKGFEPSTATDLLGQI